jgi:hypothetical protein
LVTETLPEAAIVAVLVVVVPPVMVNVAAAIALPTGKNTTAAAGPEKAMGALRAERTLIGFGSEAEVASQAPSESAS